jgi:hypothetical protein
MATIVVFPSGASAYDLSAQDAVAKTKAYAQRVVDDPRTPFSYYRLSCPYLFPHQRKCTVNYDTPQTRADEAARQAAWVCPRLPGPVQPPCGPRRPSRLAPWACTELLLSYLKPHSHSVFAPFGPYPVYLKHLSTPCGPTRLLGA